MKKKVGAAVTKTKHFGFVAGVTAEWRITRRIKGEERDAPCFRNPLLLGCFYCFLKFFSSRDLEATSFFINTHAVF